MRKAGFLGFAFGLGYFGAGVSWIYVSLHDFGGMPALVTVLVTALLCAYLALFAAAAGWLALRLAPGGGLSFVLAAAASWTLGEWLRGWLFTDSLADDRLLAGADESVAGFAPLLGVFGLFRNCTSRNDSGVYLEAKTAMVFCAWRIAPASRWIRPRAVVWTTPFGAPLSSACSGNIAQEMKFREESDRSVADLP
jgi:apolipoprotein N-acyltransferase